MNLHEADIQSRLSRFLNRRQMPRRVEGKPEAQADELRALVSAVMRCAPRDPDRLGAWWPEFESSLGELGSGMWPTEKEVRDAAKACAPQVQALVAEAGDFDGYAITAARMSRGEPVGECYLYGREACELISRGLVDEPTMRKYRSGAYFRRKDIYGADAAQAWEADAKDRHDAARKVFATRGEEPTRRNIQMPGKGVAA